MCATPAEIHTKIHGFYCFYIFLFHIALNPLFIKVWVKLFEKLKNALNELIFGESVVFVAKQKLWPNFSDHQLHQGWAGDSSTSPHPPNVGSPTDSERWTDYRVRQPSTTFWSGYLPNQTWLLLPIIISGHLGGRVKNHGFHIIYKVSYIVHSICYSVTCALSTHVWCLSTHRPDLFSQEGKQQGRAMRRVTPLFGEHSTKTANPTHTQ